MRIGELSQRTDTSRRLLRYYEEQGLIVSTRALNGYREYEETSVSRVHQIRGLLALGLPTRIIREILPCLKDNAAIHFDEATPEMLGTIECESARIAQRIHQLQRQRDAVASYLAEIRSRLSRAELMEREECVRRLDPATPGSRRRRSRDVQAAD